MSVGYASQIRREVNHDMKQVPTSGELEAVLGTTDGEASADSSADDELGADDIPAP